MGYDMRMRDQIAPAPNEVLEPLKADTDAASELSRIVHGHFFQKYRAGEIEGSISDQAAVKLADRVFNEAWDKYSAASDPGYFRLNIHGMSRYRDAMLQIGMAHNSDNPVETDEWPEYPEDVEDSDEAEAKYNELADPLRARHITADPTIPLHKFGSNDGWVVTPDECHTAVTIWGVWDDQEGQDRPEVVDTDYWHQWIGFLRSAADHGGFRVH